MKVLKARLYDMKVQEEQQSMRHNVNQQSVLVIVQNVFELIIIHKAV